MIKTKGERPMKGKKIIDGTFDMRKVPEELKPTINLMNEMFVGYKDLSTKHLSQTDLMHELWNSHHDMFNQLEGWGNTFFQVLELIAEKGFDFRDILPLLPEQTQTLWQEVTTFDIEKAQDTHVKCAKHLGYKVPKGWDKK